MTASFTTYAPLKAAVAAWATKQGLTTQIPDFVAWAHQEICRKLRAPILYARASLTVDAETIAAPPGFLAAKRFYLDLTPRRILHLKDSAELVDLTVNLVPTIYPTYFAVEGQSTLAFAPLFSGSITGQMLYYQAPGDLVNDTDTNVVLATYPYLYLYGALEALYRYMEDDGECDRYGALFGALIQSINLEEAKDATRGPLVGSPGTLGVV